MLYFSFHFDITILQPKMTKVFKRSLTVAEAANIATSNNKIDTSRFQVPSSVSVFAFAHVGGCAWLVCMSLSQVCLF